MKPFLFAFLLVVGGCTADQAAKFDKAVVQGQLYCSKATALGPIVVALADMNGVPISVTGRTAATVSAACAAVQAIPVSPPPNPSQAPVVAAPIAALK